MADHTDVQAGVNNLVRHCAAVERGESVLLLLNERGGMDAELARAARTGHRGGRRGRRIRCGWIRSPVRRSCLVPLRARCWARISCC